MGLPRELRLRRRVDFTRVTEEGRGRSNSLVVLRYSPNALPASRCGLAVSRRVGRAVQRNRVKRLLREAVRALPVRTGYDLVLIARPEVARARHAEIVEAVADVVGRAGLLDERPSASQPAREEL